MHEIPNSFFEVWIFRWNLASDALRPGRCVSRDVPVLQYGELIPFLRCSKLDGKAISHGFISSFHLDTIRGHKAHWDSLSYRRPSPCVCFLRSHVLSDWWCTQYTVLINWQPRNNSCHARWFALDELTLQLSRNKCRRSLDSLVTLMIWIAKKALSQLGKISWRICIVKPLFLDCLSLLPENCADKDMC